MLELAHAQFSDCKNHARGDGHAVVLFPGLGTDHSCMAPLANHCQRLGYACRHWGRGRNTGPTGPILTWLRHLASDIEELIREYPKKVTLMGWSLGGIYAREVAKAIPGRVRRVVTLGTPCRNVSDSTNVRWLYDVLNPGSAMLSASLKTRLKTPPPVPTTSIYSRSDGIVAWEACRLAPGSLAENIEVDSSHLGLIWHPDVFQVIAKRLSRTTAAENDAS